jgi:hypothetical protein
MLEYVANSQPWTGERINDTSYPRNIEQLWSSAELAEIGLQVHVPTPPTLDAVKAQKIAAAWSEQEQRFAASSVTVTVNGYAREYGCDSKTRENILAIVGAISAVPDAIPDPRPFTPKGQAAPVATSHAEFKSIYVAGLARGDAFYAAYLAHKVAIAALTTSEAVSAYDLSAGWPI